MIDTRIVAFDFFDTLVHRNCHPEEVLYEWAKKCSRFFEFKISPIEIYKMRKEVEKQKNNEIEEFSYNLLILKIYDKIKEVLKDNTISQIDFAEFSYKTEISIEVSRIYGDDENIKRLKYFYKKGKEIIIISDFYMGLRFYNIILEKLRIKNMISHIFVSSEYGKRKDTGNLYNVMFSKLNLKPQEVTMIGDNRLSDYKIPKTLGMKVLFVNYQNKQDVISKNQLKKYFHSLTHKKIKENPLNGYTGELLYFFDKLYKNVSCDKVRDILFCSREGQLMKILFDKYQTIFWGDILIKSKYFYVSRKAVLVASLKELDQEDFDMIFRQYKEVYIFDFMKTIGFDENFILTFCKNNQLDIREKVTAKTNDKVIQKLKSNIEFKEKYDILRKFQHEYFLKYLMANCESYKDGKIVLIDVGWKGTIQDCIRRIIPEEIQLKGYYIGLITKEYGCINPEQKVGILFTDYPNKSSNYEILKHEYMLYERIFTANHGPVDGYCFNKNGEIVPQFNKSKNETELYEFIKEYQDKLINVFEKMLVLYKKTCYLPSDLYEFMVKNALWRNCVDYPLIWRLKDEFQRLTLENFGNTKEKDRSWSAIFRRLRANPFSFTDYSVRIIEQSHLRIFLPLVNIYCKIIYLFNLKKVVKVN